MSQTKSPVELPPHLRPVDPPEPQPQPLPLEDVPPPPPPPAWSEETQPPDPFLRT